MPASRKNRNNRKNRRTNRMYGGAAYVSAPMPLNESLAGSSPSQMNLRQGGQYESFHTNQHGGMAPLSAITDSLLPKDMAAGARTLPLDKYIADVAPLRDPGQGGQMGGRRRTRNSHGRFTKRRAGRKGTKRHSRKGRKSTKHHTRKGRKRNVSGRFLKMRGGAAQPPLDLAAPSNAPGMLLDARTEASAMRGMNPEWSLAPNPNSFAPRV